MKKLMIIGLLLLGMTAQAQMPRMPEPGATDQTARKFTLDLTDDGKARWFVSCPRNRRVRQL